MSAWISKSRSNGLWTTIDKYVTAYSTANNIAQDEHWLKSWRELITVHKITKKKRDFEFIAYIITGNPEVTVVECLQHLYTLIPFLDQHITITKISDIRNIKYTCNDKKITTTETETEEPPSQNNNDNSFAPLASNQSDIESNAEQAGLELILNSESTATQQKENINVYSQALSSATSTLRKLSDYTNPTNETEQSTNINEHIAALDRITDDALEDFKLKSDEITSNTESMLRHIDGEMYDNFRDRCNLYYKETIKKLNSEIEKTLRTIDISINAKMNTLDQKLKNLEKKNKHTNTPSKPTTSPIHPTTTIPIKQFGATKTSYDTTPIQNYFQHNLKFEHQGDIYYLQDKDFLKNSPKIENPVSVDDGLTLYVQLQKNALIYNIFITPIDKITIWDMSPNTVPTTCNLDIDNKHNFLQTYERSAVAIYTKLQNTIMTKVPFFKQILEHERTSQDGYKVLYGMLCICHPKLMEKTKTEPPTLQTNGSLFTLIRQYTNYIKCERIANRTYTDVEKLSFIMNALESDGRFDKALSNLRIHKNMYEELSKTSPQAKFPPSLTVEILPYTIMKSYTTEEKHELFTNTDTTPVVRAFKDNKRNFRYNNKTTTTNRQRIETTCKCCGISGHDVNSTGCDFAASFLLTTDYLRNNPHMKRNIINNFKAYQSTKLTKMKNKKVPISDRIKRSAQDKRIGISPTIKLFIEAIGDAFEDEDDSEQIDDVFDISEILTEDTNPDSHEGFHDTTDTEHPTNK